MNSLHGDDTLVTFYVFVVTDVIFETLLDCVRQMLYLLYLASLLKRRQDYQFRAPYCQHVSKRVSSDSLPERSEGLLDERQSLLVDNVQPAGADEACTVRR